MTITSTISNTRRLLTWITLLLGAGNSASGAESELHYRLSASERDSIRISNGAGSVHVTGWDQPNVEVLARLFGGAARVDAVRENGLIRVQVVYDKKWKKGGADLDIRIPRSSHVEISTRSAEVQIAKARGSQRISTIDGDIQVSLARNLEAETLSGDIHLTGSGEPGNIRASSISGSIVMDGVSGDLDARTTNGDLVLNAWRTRSARIRTTSGTVTLHGTLEPDGIISAESVSGDITVRLSADAGYRYEAMGFGGQLRTCFDGRTEKAARSRPGAPLSGNTGAGRGQVRVRSMSGNIEICK